MVAQPGDTDFCSADVDGNQTAHGTYDTLLARPEQRPYACTLALTW
jgi:hypothetical protein